MGTPLLLSCATARNGWLRDIKNRIAVQQVVSALPDSVSFNTLVSHAVCPTDDSLHLFPSILGQVFGMPDSSKCHALMLFHWQFDLKIFMTLNAAWACTLGCVCGSRSFRIPRGGEMLTHPRPPPTMVSPWWPYYPPPPPLAQARPRSQKSGQNGGSTPTPRTRPRSHCPCPALHAPFRDVSG